MQSWFDSASTDAADAVEDNTLHELAFAMEDPEVSELWVRLFVDCILTFLSQRDICAVRLVSRYAFHCSSHTRHR